MSDLKGAAEAGKRVKIFTVHGTFAHEAQWDNWDVDDTPDKPGNDRHFVNRLSDYLQQNGVQFDQADHTEFNWSGGNSHDERRTAAISLKKKFEEVLHTKERETGKKYKEIYTGGVYVIAHSHGGTLSRLAMNLWDKGDDFYDPDAAATDELKHDDKCPHCRQHRNFEVEPAKIDRPNGVITFGSPFVHFRKHEKPLIAARLFAKSMMFVGFLGVLTWYLVKLLRMIPSANAQLTTAQKDEVRSAGLNKGAAVEPSSPEIGELANNVIDHFIQWLNAEPMATIITLLWPLALFWLFALYIPNRLKARYGGEGGKKIIAASFVRVTKWLGLALLAIYFIDYFTAGSTGLWNGMVETVGPGKISAFWWLFPLIIYWVFALSLPKQFLQTLSGKLEDLGNRLPEKFDPPEDPTTSVRYLSYYTPGDEAGLGLRLFGILTWIMQTIWMVIAAALFTFVIAIIVMLVASPFGLQEVIWNNVFGLPVKAWNLLFSAYEIPLVAAEKAPYVTVVLFFSFLIGVVAILPGALLGFSILYLVALKLRGSGLAFGGERLAWTMAASIGASPRPSPLTKMRRMTIAPQAWQAGEMAHCYFYKCGKVIEDVAKHIADWPNMVQPSKEKFVRAMALKLLRWLVVFITVMSLFLMITKITNGATIGASAKNGTPKIENNTK